MGRKKPSDFHDFFIFRKKLTTQTLSVHAPPQEKKRNKNVTKGKNYFSELYMELEITLVIKEGLLTFMTWKDPYSQMP